MLTLGRVALVCAVILSCSRPDSGELFIEPLFDRGGARNSPLGGGASDAGDTDSGGGTREPGGSDAGRKTSETGGAAGRPAAGRESGAGGSNEAGDGGEGAETGTSGSAGTSGSSGAAGTSGSGGTSGGISGAAGTAGVNGGTGGQPPGPTCVPEVCDGVDNDCDEVVDPAGTCPVDCIGATRPDHHTYLICYSIDRTWLDAQHFCEEHDAHLVHIDSPEENLFITEQLRHREIWEGDPAWIGATDSASEGTWVWDGQGGPTAFYDGTTGSAIGNRFGAWDEGEPNDQNEEGEDCAVIEPTPGEGAWHWDDRPCTREMPALACEREN